MRLGQDVEVFLCDANGKHISVLGMIGADKWNPMQVPDMEPGFTLQEDNVALEFGMPPAASIDEWDQRIQAIMDASKKYVNGLSISPLASHEFTADQLEHPAAFEFGCEPDHNAWTGEANPKPRPTSRGLRSAGGHIHIETKLDPLAVVRACDLFLGVPSVLMDKDDRRKVMYGKAGAHRIKPYGVEYRVLSNFWAHDSKLRYWAWRNVELALNSIGMAETVEAEIVACINNNDKELAKHLVEVFGLEVA